MLKKHLLFLLPALGILFGFLFELKWYYMIATGIIYYVFLRQIQKHQILQSEEMHQFRQINSYMSQMSQSFVRTKNILSSLQETKETFPLGNMQTLLLEVIDILLLEGGDITAAEKKALSHLETKYPCEKLNNLHEFMLLAESQGGDCRKEFVLLEKMRLAWESAVLKYHRNLIDTRNLSTFSYGLMLMVCIFTLHAFPKELSIIQMEFIQLTNCILVSLFIVFFTIMDKRINGHLFRKAQKMTHKKEIETAFPKWLFDLMLLIQRESVESAILHSIPSAPPVLQPELTTMSQLLLEHPGDIHVFTSFLAEYQLPQVEMNMRKLYALSVGADQQEESISFMIESNMDSLMHAEEKSYELKGDLSSLFQFLPLLVVSIGMLIYCAAIILVSLSRISALFE